MLIIRLANLKTACLFVETGEDSLGSLLPSVISGFTKRSFESFFNLLAVFGDTIVVTGERCCLIMELMLNYFCTGSMDKDAWKFRSILVSFFCVKRLTSSFKSLVWIEVPN